VREVRDAGLEGVELVVGPIVTGAGPPTRGDQNTQMAHHDVQRDDRHEPARRAGVGGTRRQSTPVPVLISGVLRHDRGARGRVQRKKAVLVKPHRSSGAGVSAVGTITNNPPPPSPLASLRVLCPHALLQSLVVAFSDSILAC
jgi:hypothetical protein